jgi:glycosyltransferase involved in cell wall biosynthesis
MSRRRRVLALNQFALPRTSAGGTRHVELFGLLQEWDATVLAGSRTLSGQEPVAPEGILRTVPVTRYKGNGAGRLVNWASYCVGALARGATSRKPTVVYGSSPQMGAALAGLIVAKIRRARFVLEVRDLWPQILVEAGTLSENSLLYRTLKRLERFLYRSADAIVVLAEGSISAVVAEGGNHESIVFIPNGADPSDFDVAESRDALRREFGFKDFVVVYAGAHGPANGLDFVIEAAQSLSVDRPEARFVLVGDGVDKPKLQARCADLGLTNVEFRTPIPKDKIPRLFHAADVGLHCLDDVPLFRHGVSPNKLYDYMASELPVLTNTPGDVASMVEQARSGYAVEPTGIADGVRRLFEATPQERSDMGRAGRIFMQDHRSRRAMAARLERLLDSVADRRKVAV